MEFAQVVNGVVVNLLTLEDDAVDPANADGSAEAVFSSLGLDGSFLLHSPSGEFRGKRASVGDMYDSETDQFVTITVEL